MFLFDEVKRTLSGRSFDNADDVLPSIHEVLRSFDKEMLICGFCAWMKRFQPCIDTVEECVG
jgi:hypothetical protein